MKSGYSIARENVFKTWFLMSFFLVAIIGIGFWLSEYYHNSMILYGAVAFSLITNLVSYFQSDKIALKMSGARPANPSNELDLKAIRAVENMALVAGIQTPKVYIIDDTGMNAFATGRDERHSAVAVTSGLLKALEKTEIEGVVAHEIGHIRNRDILIMTIAVTLVGVFSILVDFLRNMAFHSDRDRSKNPIIFAIGIGAIIISPIVAQLIQLAISRRREYIADATGAEISRNPRALASALRKISHNPKVSRASSATAHLYIAEPVLAKKSSILAKISNLFMTHPPIEKRIELLERM